MKTARKAPWDAWVEHYLHVVCCEGMATAYKELLLKVVDLLESEHRAARAHTKNGNFRRTETS